MVFSADAAALRLRRARAACRSMGADALLLIGGVDGPSPGCEMSAALNFLFHGVSGRALSDGTPAPRLHDDTFVLVRPGRVVRGGRVALGGCGTRVMRV